MLDSHFTANMTKSCVRNTGVFIFFLLFCNVLVAQSSLVLSSSTVAAGGTISLNLSLLSPVGGSPPAALQWTLNFPAADLTSLTITPGPVLVAANKTITCAGAAGAPTCLATGANENTIANGVIATVNITVAAAGNTAAFGLVNAMGVSVAGAAIPFSSTGSLLTVPGTAAMSSLTCALGILNPGNSTPCTLNMTGVAAKPVTVILSSSSASVILPASIVIPAGSSSVTFTATAGSFLADLLGVVIAASLNGASQTAGLSLVTLAGVSSLQCSPASLTANSNATCTVILSKPAPAAGVSVSISDNTAQLTVPSFVTVPAGFNTATFFVSTATLSTTQIATITASLNGSSGAASISLLVPQPVFTLHTDASEVSGVKNGSIVTPSRGPAGFLGKVAINGSGSVNFTQAETGNGVYFLNCCANANNAYYKFTGSAIGNIFNVNQGQVSFFLKSRYSFAQRQATAPGPRYTFDVRDNLIANHLFSFWTQTNGGSLMFAYTVAGVANFYIVPQGSEDTIYGNGVILKVLITWGGNVANLYLNGTLVASTLYTTAIVPNWTAASVFDLGAYELLTFGGFSISDDIIDEFTVSILPGN
jgi:hypothetical protein